jgi:hypothetical protein
MTIDIQRSGENQTYEKIKVEHELIYEMSDILKQIINDKECSDKIASYKIQKAIKVIAKVKQWELRNEN